jgi:hypothetical protein
MKVPFISGEGPDGYLPVNLYFSPRKIHKRDALVGRPGLLEWSDLGHSAGIRDWCVNDGNLYALCGAKLYRIDAFGGSSHIGTVDHDYGHAWMEGNGSQVCIVENNKCYIYNGATLKEIGGEDMSFSPGSLAYEGGYFLAHDVETDNWYESSLYDGTDWNHLDYAITSVKPDHLTGLYASSSEVFAFGGLSGEIYYNSGGSSFSFSKVPGGNIPCGTAAEKSVASFLSSLFMLNNHRVVVQATTQPVKMSNEHVDREIEDMTTVSDAIGFCFTMAGHTFYVLTFPHADKTFVLDITTKFWYIWKTGSGRWRPNCYIRFADKHLVGDYENGKIYELSQTTYTDDGDEIIRQRTMPVQKDENFYTFAQFEIDQEAGVGLSTGQGSDPQAVLEISKDKGKTWSYEKWCDIGKAGKYNQRLLWRRLGRHRQFTLRVTVTDPVKTVWTGAYINGDR